MIPDTMNVKSELLFYFYFYYIFFSRFFFSSFFLGACFVGLRVVIGRGKSSPMVLFRFDTRQLLYLEVINFTPI